MGQKPQFLRVQSDACEKRKPTGFARERQHRNSCALLQRGAMNIPLQPKDGVSRVPSTPNHDW